ncbi:MAG: M1 family peptidase, partial [Bacteroidetes Order II. Incertae sedis bacterium]|nr:M1 family peptidase [Bacteroidetes Order II. bacterium]
MNSILSRLLLVLFFATGSVSVSYAQNWRNIDGDIKAKNHSMFRPIEDWPDPNEYRNASGAPGYQYWQQRADYVIRASLDTQSQSIIGSERITYHNNSPDELGFLWVQLDQNVRSLEHSRNYQTAGALPERISPQFRQFVGVEQFDGGFDISRVQLVTANGSLVDAVYRIRDTIMRINLPDRLAPGEAVAFDIDWSYRIP